VNRCHIHFFSIKHIVHNKLPFFFLQTLYL